MSGPGVIPRQVGSAAVPMQDSSALVTEPLQQIARVGQEFATAQIRAGNAQRLQQTTLDATKQLDDLHLKFATDPDPATAASRFADEAAKIHDNGAAALTDPESQAQFQHQFGMLTEARRIDVASDAVRRQTNEAQTSIIDGLDHYGKDYVAAKSDVERKVIADMAGTSLTNAVKSHIFDAKTAQALGSKWREHVADYQAQWDMEADPVASLKALNNRANYPELDEGRRLALIREAGVQIRVREADAERAVFHARQAREQASEAALNDTITKLVADPQSVTAKDIAASRMNASTKIEMIGRLSSGFFDRETPTSGKVFDDILRRIYLPDGDPQKITSRSQFVSLVGNGLDRKDFGRLAREVESNPEENRLKQGLFRIAKSQLSGANPATGMRDPNGDTHFQRYQAWFMDQYTAKRAMGISVHDLLSPDSKEYLGKGIAMFQRTPQQQMQDVMGANQAVLRGIGGPQAAGGGNAPTRISNDAEYAKLPSGAKFVGPDGVTRTKP